MEELELLEDRLTVERGGLELRGVLLTLDREELELLEGRLTVERGGLELRGGALTVEREELELRLGAETLELEVDLDFVELVEGVREVYF